MTKNEFLVTPFHASIFLEYQGEIWWAISCDFEECLYGLVKEKDFNSEEEIRWVRCESVKLVEGKVINADFSH